MDDATNRGTGHSAGSTTRFHLAAGHDVLDAWTETAGQTRTNAVYEALFALLDGTLFHSYLVIEDVRRAGEVIVVLRDDMTMRLRIERSVSFDVVSIDRT